MKWFWLRNKKENPSVSQLYNQPMFGTTFAFFWRSLKVLHIWLLLPISFDFFQNIIQNFHLWPFLWGRPPDMRRRRLFYEWGKRFTGIDFMSCRSSLPHSSQLFKKVDVVLFCSLLSFFLHSLSPCTQEETTVWRAPFDKVKTYCRTGDIFYPPTTTNDISESKKGR